MLQDEATNRDEELEVDTADPVEAPRSGLAPLEAEDLLAYPRLMAQQEGTVVEQIVTG